MMTSLLGYLSFQNGVAKKRTANQNILGTKCSTNNQELSNNNDLLSTSQVKQFFGPTSADVPGNLIDNNLSDSNFSDNSMLKLTMKSVLFLLLLKCLTTVCFAKYSTRQQFVL